MHFTTRQFTTRLAAVAASLMASAGAASAAPRTQAMVVSGAWSRPTPPGSPTGVVYLSIVNSGRSPDRLVGASTAVAARMELHRSTLKGGVMSMDAVPGGIIIPADGRVALAPNGYHFMLVGLTKGLSPGGRFPATLTFAHAGAVRVQVQVRATAPEPAMAGMTMR